VRLKHGDLDVMLIKFNLDAYGNSDSTHNSDKLARRCNNCTVIWIERFSTTSTQNHSLNMSIYTCNNTTTQQHTTQHTPHDFAEYNQIEKKVVFVSFLIAQTIKAGSCSCKTSLPNVIPHVFMHANHLKAKHTKVKPNTQKQVARFLHNPRLLKQNASTKCHALLSIISRVFDRRFSLFTFHPKHISLDQNKQQYKKRTETLDVLYIVQDCSMRVAFRIFSSFNTTRLKTGIVLMGKRKRRSKKPRDKWYHR
jgi:hypothetical protein